MYFGTRLSYINGLLCEIEKCLELGAKFSENAWSSLLFGNDFAGVVETRSALKRSIDIVHVFSSKRFFCNFSKCARFQAGGGVVKAFLF